MGPVRQRQLALVCAALSMSCGASVGVPESVSSSAESPLRVFAEGLCPKLEVQAASERRFLVYGTYGLDAARFQLSSKQAADVGAAQAFVEIGGDRLVRWPTMWKGVPTTEGGYLSGDLEIGGHYPDTLWLARIETKRGSSARLLYAREPRYYAWQPGGGWKPHAKAREMATVGALAPKLPLDELCQGHGEAHFATYAAERRPSGAALVAGRCEDDLHRAQGGVRLASFTPGQADWRLFDAPPSPLFDTIINLGLVWTSPREAHLYAYPPYVLGEAPSYVVRFDGSSWTQIDVPLPGPVVAMAATKDALWAVGRWRELWRRREGDWQQIALPPPRFVEPPPTQLRILDSQAHGDTLWVHAAYPIAVAGAARSAARGHVLYTTAPVSAPVYCDRRRPAAEALSFEGPVLQGAEQPD